MGQVHREKSGEAGGPVALFLGLSWGQPPPSQDSEDTPVSSQCSRENWLELPFFSPE